MKKVGLRMHNHKLKSKQNNHIRDFPNHVNISPYLVIFHNDNKHIHDATKSDHSQNNTHFITNNCCTVKTKVTMVNQGRSPSITLLIQPHYIFVCITNA